MDNHKFDVTLFTTDRLIKTRERLKEDFVKDNIVETELAHKVYVYYVNKIEAELKSRKVKF